MDLFQPWHLIVLFFIGIGIFLIPTIFYILTLQGALQKCSPGLRTMEPGMAWLCIVPLVNIVFSFFIVLALAKSLRNEFNYRRIPVADPEPGQNIGMAMAVCACCAFIPFLGFLAAIAHIVLWIMYWFKIAEYSRMLDYPPQYAPPGVAY